MKNNNLNSPPNVAPFLFRPVKVFIDWSMGILPSVQIVVYCFLHFTGFICYFKAFENVLAEHSFSAQPILPDFHREVQSKVCLLDTCFFPELMNSLTELHTIGCAVFLIHLQIKAVLRILSFTHTCSINTAAHDTCYLIF